MIQKIPVRDFSITSYWSCVEKEVKGQKVWGLKSAPSLGSAIFTFTYTVPSGGKIKQAFIWTTFGSPLGGISQCTMNGVMFDKVRGGERGAVVDISSVSGQYEATFKFRSNGKVFQDANSHHASLSFSNTYLEIEFEYVDGEPAPEVNPYNEQEFTVPPQSVCIYDPNEGSVFTFDGVNKVQHALTMDLQEEPSKNQKEYVNNARNEPDKVTLDVMMSDVYSGGGDILSKAGQLSNAQRVGYENTIGSLIARDAVNPWTRSEAALYTLHELKEARKRLTLITPHYVHVDMIIAAVTVDQDDTTPFGWKGQIVLQHAFKKEAEKKAPKKTTGDGDGDVSGSMFSWLFSGVKDVKSEIARVASVIGGG